MGEIVADNTLYNCTGILLLKLDPARNMSALWTLNRSQVLELLDFAVGEVDRIKSPIKRLAIRDFISECLFPSPRPYDLVWWQKLVWTIIFAAMLVVSTGGNIIVMWIVLGKYILCVCLVNPTLKLKLPLFPICTVVLLKEIA